MVCGKGDGVRAECARGTIEKDAIDQMLGEEGSVEAGSGLEQNTEEVAFGERVECGAEAQPTGVLGQRNDFHAIALERSDPRGRNVGSAEDKEVVL